MRVTPSSQRRRRRSLRTALALACFLLAGATSLSAHALSHCQGPAACCPAEIVDTVKEKHEVTLGVVLGGVYNVNEKSATYDADYYLYERWRPAPGFQPQTEIVNEISRESEQFEETDLRDGICVRVRRMYSKLHSNFNLRRFPFDEQTMKLVLSDADYDSSAVAYSAKAAAAGVSGAAREALSSWKFEGDLGYERHQQAFEWEDAAPSYDYATFSFQLRRHVTHHLTKFFLPLLVIVALAFLVFWIAPEDLSSQVNIGVTCVLSAIAFQFVQASSLPEVAYTTLNDRVYVVCYVAIALALMVSVYANAQVRKGQTARAISVMRHARWFFPVATVCVLLFVCAWSFAKST